MRKIIKYIVITVAILSWLDMVCNYDDVLQNKIPHYQHGVNILILSLIVLIIQDKREI